MKIGIITCGYVDPPLSDSHGQYVDMIETAFANVNGAMTFQNYDAIKGELPSLDECRGFIITGSVHNAYDDLPWILALVDWIRRCEETRKPLVGICFGHQIIARALGGVVEKSHKGWGLGSCEVKIVAYKEWMNLAIDSARMLVSHQDQVVTVPEAMSVIAGNDFCPNFMLVKDDHILTVQGHPEFSTEFTEKLVLKRQHLLPLHQYEDAFVQLKKPNDSVRFLHWMDAFFTRER